MYNKRSLTFALKAAAFRSEGVLAMDDAAAAAATRILQKRIPLSRSRENIILDNPYHFVICINRKEHTFCEHPHIHQSRLQSLPAVK